VVGDPEEELPPQADSARVATAHMTAAKKGRMDFMGQLSQQATMAAKLSFEDLPVTLTNPRH
jgi:hypothetical protein